MSVASVWLGFPQHQTLMEWTTAGRWVKGDCHDADPICVIVHFDAYQHAHRIVSGASAFALLLLCTTKQFPENVHLSQRILAAS